MKNSFVQTALLFLLIIGCTPAEESETEMQSMDAALQEDDTTAMSHQDTPYVAASDPIQAGRYLVIVAGCNDCHTDGYLMTQGNVAEENWLAGSPLGWQGPWGTTYASNLRLRAQEWSEGAWVQTLKTRKALPPMAWMNVSQMNEQDMKAIYAYIRSLGPKGEQVPLAVPPDSMPGTPYLSLIPQNLPTQ